MKSKVTDSIRARLRNKTRDVGTDFQLFLVRYACERFLYRLGASAERGQCILKGATLLGFWMEEPYRATRDVDLLALGENNEEAVRKVITTICNVPCPQDGLDFDLNSLQVSPVREHQGKGGQRARLTAYLGKARIPVQVDFGFGDVVTPGVEEVQLPILIDGVPAPLLQIYPQVTTIAEKFQAMVQLGGGNSRMKDFHDIWALSETFAFDGAELQEAVAGCFKQRGTKLSAEIPEALATAFYADVARQELWQAYGNQGGLLYAPPDRFEEVGIRIQSFLAPVYARTLADEVFDLSWPAAGPWQARA